jgi:hypothetical protein
VPDKKDEEGPCSPRPLRESVPIAFARFLNEWDSFNCVFFTQLLVGFDVRVFTQRMLLVPLQLTRFALRKLLVSRSFVIFTKL